jgi:hypothetical protein
LFHNTTTQIKKQILIYRSVRTIMRAATAGDQWSPLRDCALNWNLQILAGKKLQAVKPAALIID